MWNHVELYVRRDVESRRTPREAWCGIASNCTRGVVWNRVELDVVQSTEAAALCAAHRPAAWRPRFTSATREKRSQSTLRNKSINQTNQALKLFPERTRKRLPTHAILRYSSKNFPESFRFRPINCTGDISASHAMVTVSQTSLSCRRRILWRLIEPKIIDVRSHLSAKFEHILRSGFSDTVYTYI